MVTPLIFIISLVLLLRRSKSKRSRKIIGFLYASFAVWFVYSILTYGSYTLPAWSKCYIESLSQYRPVGV